ncbi:acylneuraminate cytidylyltransferase family protein [Gammaproteobacteria bacterium]|nr:acylneuraminate cytidylyltransferase family protein [Gammaproteobacteria bacterium]
MYKNKKILAIIPARGQSKRVPNKNLKPFAETSLLEVAYNEAKKVTCIDKIILSSDSSEIINKSKSIGLEAPFVRPESLSGDSSSSISVVLHALNSFDCTFDFVLLLQPTSPLRTHTHIEESISKCIDEGLEAIVSVNKYKFSSDSIYFSQNDLLRKLNNKNFDDIYFPNGAIYLTSVTALLRENKLLVNNTGFYEMGFEFSDDVDTLDEFKVAEFKFKLKQTYE